MPDPFHDILGQDAPLDRLRAALANGRLPHGLLFAGPVGVGKFTAAVALAKVFLGDTADVAHRIDTNSHPDFHVVTRQLVRFHDKTGKSKALSLGVDVVREEIVRPASNHSVEGVGKVFVVEEAETMNAAAQNALLKTLEEPAGRTLIVLLTDAAESLLATIRSRCQTFRFAPLSVEQAVRVLEMRGVDAGEAEEAVRVAGGSPGRALAFIEDGVVKRAAELAGLFGGKGDLAAWMKESAEAHATRQLERDPLGSKDALTRAGYALYLSLAGDLLRRRLREVDDADRLERLCGKIDAVARADLYLSANANVALTMQQLAAAL